MLPVSRARASRRSGAALVMSLLVVAVVMLLAGTFSRFAASMTRASVHLMDRTRAFYVAEAGLAEAYAGLVQARSGNVGSMQDPAVFGDGLFWVEAEELEPGIVQLTSTGMVAGGRAELALVLEEGQESIVSLGLYADAALALLPGTLVDSFDSSEGPYDGLTQVHTDGVLGSNAAVTLEGSAEHPTTILGDVTPGPGHSAELLGSDVVVTGSMVPGREASPLPPPTTPEVELVRGRVHSGSTPLIVPPGTSGAEFLTLTANTEATLQGPSRIVLGSLVVEPGAQLTFDTSGGPIELYVLDELHLEPDSTLVTSDIDPDLVTIQVPGETSSPVSLSSTSTFFGVVYAPGTRVEVSSAFEIFGALIGKELALGRGVQLHFDSHLSELAAELALPKQVSWEILDLSNATTGILADPFSLLGVDRAALLPPAESHEDQWLELAYLDLTYTERSYAGWESAFDWSQVSEVLKGARDGEVFVLPGELVAGNPQDPTAADANSSPALTAINDSSLDSAHLKDELLPLCPLEDRVLDALIDRTDPEVNSSDLKRLFEASTPLSDAALRSIIHRAALDDSHLKDVLVLNSPLSADVLDTLATRDPPMPSSDYDKVVAAQ